MEIWVEKYLFNRYYFWILFKTSPFALAKVVRQYPVSKKQDTILLPVTSPNVDRLSKFFHQQTQWWLCNEIIIKQPTAP